MDDRFGIDLIQFAPYLDQVHSYPNYFNSTALTNTAPNCVINVNDYADNAYTTDQGCIDQLGEIMAIEADKLGAVSGTFDYLESTLTALYDQPVWN